MADNMVVGLQLEAQDPGTMRLSSGRCVLRFTSDSVGVNSIESKQVHINIQYEVVQPCLRKDEQAALPIYPLVVQRRQLVDLDLQQVHIPMIACSASDSPLAQSLA